MTSVLDVTVVPGFEDGYYDSHYSLAVVAGDIASVARDCKTIQGA